MYGESEKPAEVSADDKALAKDWQKRIDAALSLRKADFARWKENRTLLTGKDKSGKKLRTNLHFANLAAMRPQVYAKDPEFACKPNSAVPQERMEQIQAFGETAEAVIYELLVKRAKLKRRAKRILTSAYTTGLGWWKACWQEERSRDPLIENQIKDTQDNLKRLEYLKHEASEDEGSETELRRAELQQTLQGLMSQPELKMSQGVTLDFVGPDDMLVLDASVREVTDYERADALAHRVWMTRQQYKERFGCESKKGRVYREGDGGSSSAGLQEQQGAADKDKDLLAVWEIWQQSSGRVFTLCEGEEGFCRPPYSPDWTGKRWYPFFLLAFNEVDGQFLPLSDIDLTAEVVAEYNKARDDFERDRKDCLPLNIARKGGSLTQPDLERIRNRNGVDLILVEGAGGRPLSDDIWMGQMGQLRPENYDTSPARQDMEMLVGGGDAARGSVLKAKTATEAEILSQGLRGRSAERTDTIEDMLSECGVYVLEMCLRKMDVAEVQKIAGPNAVWPELSAEQVFDQVTLTVRGGSTGKPDRLQDQDRWTKLLPVIEKAMAQVSQLRAAGNNAEAEAIVELVRETLRRFDERVDLNRFLPPQEDGQEQQPQIPPEVQKIVEELQGRLQEAEKALQDKTAELQAEVQTAQIDADAQVQTASIQAESAENVAAISAAASVDAAAMSPMPMAAPMQSAAPAAPARPKAPKPAQPQQPDLMSVMLPALLQMQQQLAALSMGGGQAKPLMQVIHERDAQGRVVRSYQQPMEARQ